MITALSVRETEGYFPTVEAKNEFTSRVTTWSQPDLSDRTRVKEKRYKQIKPNHTDVSPR